MHFISVQNEENILDLTAFEEYIKNVASAGIDGIDFPLFAFTGKNNDERFYNRPLPELLEYFGKYKAVMDRYGVRVGQTHSPFPTWKYGDETDFNEYMIHATHVSFDLTKFLGTDTMIVHPVHAALNILSAEQKKLNMEFYTRFIDDAKRTGVKICLENMWARRNGNIFDSACADMHEAVEYIDELNAIAGEKLYGFCFDLGHATLCGKHIRNSLDLLGDRLFALHIHDVNKLDDIHTLPYSFCNAGGKPLTDWQGFCEGLRDIGYKGHINFEAGNAFVVFPKSCHAAVCALFRAIGEYFSAEIEKEN